MVSSFFLCSHILDFPTTQLYLLQPASDQQTSLYFCNNERRSLFLLVVHDVHLSCSYHMNKLTTIGLQLNLHVSVQGSVILPMFEAHNLISQHLL